MTSLRRVNIGLFVLTLAASSAPAQDKSTAIDEYLQALADKGAFQGSVLLARDGQIMLRKGYGPANAELDVPNTPATKFRLASITKQFTAAAVLALQERGMLNVNDRACQYLPSCPEAWTDITIHQLLIHTSGIPNYTAFRDFAETVIRPASPAQVMAYFAEKPLDFLPGKGFNYSNSGYVVLGRIIEAASGRSYEEFLREAIMKPLQMSASGYDRFTSVLRNRATGYVLKDGKIDSIAPYFDTGWAYAAGGLYSTVDDLYLWTQALDRGDLLSTQLLNRMFTSYANGYGYGWVITQFLGHRVAAHDGDTLGFLTFIARFPDDNAVLIVLSNQQSAALDEVVLTLSTALLQ